MSVGSNRTNSILNYLKAKSSCIEHTWNEDFTKATYNYYSNHVKVFWDSILEKLQTEYGYTRREAITYIAESSDFTVSKVKRFFSGKSFVAEAQGGVFTIGTDVEVLFNPVYNIKS